MSLQLSFLYSCFNQVLQFFVHAWQDRRVPSLVRVLFFLAAIYCFSPFDCFPDFGPGGYLDDAGIAVLLFGFVCKAVPRAVFQDARRSAKHAACGIFFLGFTGFFHLHGAQAAPIHESHDRFAQHKVYDGTSITLKSVQSHQAQQCRPNSYSNRHIAAICDQTGAFASDLNQNIPNSELVPCRNSKMSLLLFHGGQSELYDSAHMNAHKSNTSEGIVLMPPLKSEWRHSRARSEERRVGKECLE